MSVLCCVCLSRLLEQCAFWLVEVLTEGRKAKTEVCVGFGLLYVNGRVGIVVVEMSI